MSYITYIAIAIGLLILELAYFRIADKFNIIDKPNQRSSHTSITIRGGGVIFMFALIVWFLVFGMPLPYFLLGLVLISSVSFVDDIYTIRALPRLSIHLISVALLFYELSLGSYGWGWYTIALVLFIGWINAFNFMDGINGITTMYALVAIATFAYINQEVNFVSDSFLMTTAISLGIFGFFNIRKQAKSFAGDVGSVAMAFILGYLMLKLILVTGQWVYVLFFVVYGIDAVFTIIERLIRKENIFKAHRTHLYQYLANELGWPHTVVSLIYSFLQLIINSVLVFSVSTATKTSYSVALLIVISTSAYLITKQYIKRRQLGS